MSIGMEEESLNITNINLLIRFNKIWEIFPSATRVLNILLTAAATSASVKIANSKERVPNVPSLSRLSAMRRGELSATITRLMSKCLWSGFPLTGDVIRFFFIRHLAFFRTVFRDFDKKWGGIWYSNYFTVTVKRWFCQRESGIYNENQRYFGNLTMIY